MTAESEVKMAYFALAAGHGGYDPGAVATKRREKDDNLKICLLVGEKLIERGHRVDYYRTEDTACPALACRAWMEKKSADFAICFHRNSFTGVSSGSEVWTFSDELSQSIGKELAREIALAGDFVNRGRKGGGAAWISKEVPCCELEIGFLSNHEDNLRFDNNLEAIAEAIVEVLESFFGSLAIEEPVATARTSSPLHLRTGPSTSHTSILVIPQAREILVYSIKNGWARVSYQDKKGYSYTRYMTVYPLAKEPVDDGFLLEEDYSDIDIEVEEEYLAAPVEPHKTTDGGESTAKDGTFFQKIGRMILSLLKSLFKR